MATKKQTMTQDFSAVVKDLATDHKVLMGAIEPAIEEEQIVMVGKVSPADKDHKTDMVDDTILRIANDLTSAFSVVNDAYISIGPKIDALMNEARQYYMNRYKFIPEMNSSNRIYKAISSQLLLRSTYATGSINNLLSRFKKCWNENRAFSLKDPAKVVAKKGAQQLKNVGKGGDSQAGGKAPSELINALSEELIRLGESPELLKKRDAINRVLSNTATKGAQVSETDIVHCLEALAFQISIASNSSHMTHVSRAIQAAINAIMGDYDEEETEDQDPEDQE